jgi:hypothetical protein
MIGQRVTTTYGDDVHTYLIHSSPRMSAKQQPGDAPVLVDDTGEAHKLYQVRSTTLVLVRPDGYVGIRSHLATEDSLFTYLNAVLGAHQDRPVHHELALV